MKNSKAGTDPPPLSPINATIFHHFETCTTFMTRVSLKVSFTLSIQLNTNTLHRMCVGCFSIKCYMNEIIRFRGINVNKFRLANRINYLERESHLNNVEANCYQLSSSSIMSFILIDEYFPRDLLIENSQIFLSMIIFQNFEIIKIYEIVQIRKILE